MNEFCKDTAQMALSYVADKMAGSEYVEDIEKHLEEAKKVYDFLKGFSHHFITKQ